MATLIGVGPRAAPVLLEEHPQPHFGAVDVILGIQRKQDFVLANQLVKPRHQGLERVMATDFVVERPLGLSHPSIVSCRRGGPLNRSRHPMFIGLTSEHGQKCRAIDRNPWWTVFSEDVWRIARKS